MKKTILTINLLFIVSIFIGCSSVEEDYYEPLNITLTRSETNAVEAVNDFTFDLMRASENRLGDEMQNYFISPQSAAWCLAMIANGADDNSETLLEITKALHLGADATLQDVNDYCSKLISAVSKKTKLSTFSVANALYYKDHIGIKKEYVDVLKTFYNIEELRNSSNSDIDSWVSKKTGGLIKDFASKNDLDKNSFGVINSTFLTLEWVSKCDLANSELTEFRNADGSISNIPMLITVGGSESISRDEICYLLRIRLSDVSYAIYFIIPNEQHNIQDVLKHLNNKSWKYLLNNNNLGGCRTIKFPELDISTDFDFIDIIQDMGIKKIFSSDNELGNIAETPLIINKFNQSNVLKLDERGVKTSSSSYIGDQPLSFSPGNYFIMDEPFYYFITEESTGAILFAGKTSYMPPYTN